MYGNPYISASGRYWARGHRVGLAHRKAWLTDFTFFCAGLSSRRSDENSQSWSSNPNPSHWSGWKAQFWNNELYKDAILPLSLSIKLVLWSTTALSWAESLNSLTCSESVFWLDWDFWPVSLAKESAVWRLPDVEPNWFSGCDPSCSLCFLNGSRILKIVPILYRVQD